MDKKIPVGIWNFRKIIEEGYYYVDKSLLIKNVIESGEVVLMTRPRRFGKTLNLSMLHYFYEISDQPTAHLFEELAIWQHVEFRSLQGQFPVIFVTFKDIFQSTYEDMLNKFAYIISLEFKRHGYLLSSSELDDGDKARILRLQNETGSKLDLAISLQFLSHVLSKHYNKKVIVLIDEYDVPVQAAYVHNFYEKLILFVKELLTGVLKDNLALQKGVVTGIFTLAKAGILTGLNNLDIFNLTNERFADKFGFTAEEAAAMLQYYHIPDFSKVQEWYNGYIFGPIQGMFNPWSMIKCIENKGALEIYWANTSDNILLKKMIARAGAATKTDLELLLSDQVVEKTVDESIVFPDLDIEVDMIWTILLYTGYITYTHYVIKDGKKSCSLVIPNQEIKFLYKNLIKRLFIEMVRGGMAIEFLQALTEGNTEVFSNHLQNFILNSMSSHDISSPEPEQSYHLFVLGLLVMLSDDYIVKSNQESGFGRYDIMIIPKQKHRKGIVIELKKVWTRGPDALEIAAQKAIDQIIERKYDQIFKEQGIQHIVCYGIAFEGKAVLVKSINLNHSSH